MRGDTQELTRVILGSNGLIGRAIKHKFQNDNCHPLPRVVYQDWWDESQIPEIRRALTNITPSTGHLQIYLASGILSPKEDPALIKKVNELIPINIARALDGTNFQLETFGTIHETFEMHNEYIDSKRRLSVWLSENVQEDDYLHLRLHTLYDDSKPKDFMFLGSLFRCVSEGIALKMSSGKQLREFHHVDDDIEAISFLEQQGYKGIVDLNHGNMISLFEIAKGVTKCFQESGEIEAGFYLDPGQENYHVVFDPLVIEKRLGFREPISSVVEIFRKLILLG
jgi:hypothetical protein